MVVYKLEGSKNDYRSIFAEFFCIKGIITSIFGPQQTVSTAVPDVRYKLPTSGALCSVVIINKSSFKCPVCTLVPVTFTTPLVSE